MNDFKKGKRETRPALGLNRADPLEPPALIMGPRWSIYTYILGAILWAAQGLFC